MITIKNKMFIKCLFFEGEWLKFSSLDIKFNFKIRKKKVW